MTAQENFLEVGNSLCNEKLNERRLSSWCVKWHLSDYGSFLSFSSSLKESGYFKILRHRLPFAKSWRAASTAARQTSAAHSARCSCAGLAAAAGGAKQTTRTPIYPLAVDSSVHCLAVRCLHLFFLCWICYMVVMLFTWNCVQNTILTTLFCKNVIMHKTSQYAMNSFSRQNCAMAFSKGLRVLKWCCFM